MVKSAVALNLKQMATPTAPASGESLIYPKADGKWYTRAGPSGTEALVGSAGGNPTGSIIIWVTAAAPSDYLLCDGASVLRATYPDLFAVIGTYFGSVDGTHFNVPNLKGRVVVGVNSSDTEFDVMGETGGAKTHTLTTAELPTLAVFRGGSTYYFNQGTSTPDRATAGGGAAHNNLQPYMALQYIIKT